MIGTTVQKTIKHTEDGVKFYIEFAGLSTDSKPIQNDIITGSLFLEVDTGDVFAYDEETAGGTWHKITGLGGDS